MEHISYGGSMGWGRGWWRGWGPWPGHGPFSYLPPWERPGWVFRGRCWPFWYYRAPPSSWIGENFPSKGEEIRYLEELERGIREQLKYIEERLRELKGETP
jgi:hypothetical protein